MNPVVTISGGGIIGNYISLRLDKSNIKSVIIEKSKGQNSQKENIRTLTLNRFSKKLLDDIGIKVPFAAIKNIYVFDGDGSGKIDFSSTEIDEDDLSYVVFFNDLYDQLQNQERHQIFFDNEIEKIVIDNETNTSEITLSSKDKINTKFIAGCDGRNSNVAKIASLNERMHIKYFLKKVYLQLCQFQKIKLTRLIPLFGLLITKILQIIILKTMSIVIFLTLKKSLLERSK